MADVASFNGHVQALFGTADSSNIPTGFLLSQGAQFGDSVFEGLLIENKQILFKHEHLLRFYRNADFMRIHVPERPLLDRWIHKAIEASGYSDARVRLFAFRGHSGWGINNETDECFISIVIVGSRLRPDAQVMAGLRVVLSTAFRKPPHSVVDLTIKAGANYMLMKRGFQDALSRSADDAILLSHEGFISEACVENVFWVSEGLLHTPEVSPATNCLPGITRQKVIDLALAQGVRVNIGQFEPEHLLSASEVFLTGTSAGIVAVREYEGKALASCERLSLTARLRDEYRTLCQAATRVGNSGDLGL